MTAKTTYNGDDLGAIGNCWEDVSANPDSIGSDPFNLASQAQISAFASSNKYKLCQTPDNPYCYTINSCS